MRIGIWDALCPFVYKCTPQPHTLSSELRLYFGCDRFHHYPHIEEVKVIEERFAIESGQRITIEFLWKEGTQAHGIR
jgi:hypothetical protein